MNGWIRSLVNIRSVVLTKRKAFSEHGLSACHLVVKNHLTQGHQCPQS